MLTALKRELSYSYRGSRLVYGFLRGRFVHVNLQVTYRCNFHCQICDFWKEHHDPAQELTLDDIRTIGRKLNELGSLIVTLAGGEPLIREDRCEIIRVLNECGHFPILITNGWFVDDAVAKEILNAGLQEISVSVDYADPRKHDAQRGCPGAWDHAINALRLLHRNRPHRRNRVHMISVLMDDNLDEIEPLIKLSREIGVTYMVTLYSWNRGAKAHRMPTEKVAHRLLELKRRYPEFVTLTSYLERFDTAIEQGGIGNCQTGRLLMNIDSHGVVSRCIDNRDLPVANILTDGAREVAGKLARAQAEHGCSQCWTSCRGFAESMQQSPRLRQFREFFTSVKPR